MVVLAAGALVAATGLTFGTSVAAGLAGTAIIVGASLIDQLVLMPALNKGKNKARPETVLDMEQMTVSSGSPRTFAVGGTCRVPVHFMFSSSKVRERSVGVGGKGGNQARANVQEVFIDALLAVNDRYTEKLLQLLCDGKIVYYTDRNTRFISSYRMTTSVSGADLVISAMSRYDPDFSIAFRINFPVKVEGFGNANVNGRWRIVGLTPHTFNTMSTVTLRKLDATLSAIANVNAGTPALPARITIVEDQLLDHRYIWQLPGIRFGGVQGPRFAIANSQTGGSSFPREMPAVSSFSDYGLHRFFAIGMVFAVSGHPNANINGRWKVVGQAGHDGPTPYADTAYLVEALDGQNVPALYGGGPPHRSGTSETSFSVATVVTTETASVFPSGPPVFWNGTSTQGVPSVLTSAGYSAGSVPAYRDIAYIEIAGMSLLDFGNRVPLIESIIRPQESTSLGLAIELIADWCGVPAGLIETSKLFGRYCDGYFFKGSLTFSTAIQAIAVTEQLLGQERGDGRFHLFGVDDAEVIQVRNAIDENDPDGGLELSDMGCYLDGGNPEKEVVIGEVDITSLPVSVGIQFQDPDNNYGKGYISHALRHPSSARFIFGSNQIVDNSNFSESVLGFDGLLMRRSKAKAVAANVLRRLHLNAQPHDVILNSRYLHVRENDLITYTDRNGRRHQIRVIEKVRTAGMLVRIRGVREERTGEIKGSPAASDQYGLPVWHVAPPPPPTIPAIYDGPAFADRDTRDPIAWITAHPYTDASWAAIKVYESTNGGSTYSLIGTISSPPSAGRASTVLPAPPGGIPGALFGSTSITWDATSTVDIDMNSLGSFVGVGFENLTTQEVIDGEGWWCIGDEIVGVRTYTDMGNGIWRFSNLLRGLRQTLSFMSTHAVGEKVIRIADLMNRNTAIRRVYHPKGIGRTTLLKFCTPGVQPADVDAVSFTLQGWNCRPRPVWDVVPVRDYPNTNDVSVFLRRGRKLVSPGDAGPYALDETYEAHEIDFFTDAGMTTLAGTGRVTALGTGSPELLQPVLFTYTAAMQGLDGVTLGSTLYMRVHQLGTFGRGPGVEVSA